MSPRIVVGHALCVSILLAACSSKNPSPVDDTDPITADASIGSCASTYVMCEDMIAVSCTMGADEERTDCAEQGLECTPGIGCSRCRPGSKTCTGETVVECSKDGQDWVPAETCSGTGGVHCDVTDGTCKDLCGEAERDKSYVGCDYWSATTANHVKKEFDFAIIVSNPQVVPAKIVLSAAAEEGGAAAVNFEDSVAAGTVKTLRLPWRFFDSASASNLRYRGTAYHLVSSVPVTVYQFSPLDYQLTSDCTAESEDSDPNDGLCYSYSNDASLVLPSAVLTSNYMLLTTRSQWSRVAWTDAAGTLLTYADGSPAETLGSSGSTATIVAATDSTVTVVPTAAFDYLGITYPAGQAAAIELREGEGAQLFFKAPESAAECDGPDTREVVDLTCDARPCQVHATACEGGDPSGTEITATGKISVYAGSPCVFIPFDRPACDHVEEALPPLETWGTSFVAAVTRPLRDEPNFFRIISSKDGNTITFSPSSVHAPVTLAKGEVLELMTKTSFAVTGTKALLVSQFLVGQDYDGWAAQHERQSAGEVAYGDPSMTFVVPEEQYRSDYTFLTPDTYAESWVMITAPKKSRVRLDGELVEGFSDIAGTEMQVLHVKVPPGAHTLHASTGVTVQVYGFGSYTSYMFPAGLDLTVVNPVI